METKELTNALLKEKMTDAMVYRSTIITSVDLNTIVKAGVYMLNVNEGSVTNSPYDAKRGIMEVSVADSTIKQVFYSQLAPRFIAYRLNWYGTGWSSWSIKD